MAIRIQRVPDADDKSAASSADANPE